MIRKLSTIYEAEKSYAFVFKHGVDICRLSSHQGNGFLFFFVFLRLEKFYPPSHSCFKVFSGQHLQKITHNPTKVTLLPLFLFCASSSVLPGISTFLFVHCWTRFQVWRRILGENVDIIWLASQKGRLRRPCAWDCRFGAPQISLAGGAVAPPAPPASTPLYLNTSR